MLIDAHAHIFPAVNGQNAAGPVLGLGYGRIAVGPNPGQMMPPLSVETCHTAEMLLAHMDWQGVERAVLLQGPFYGDSTAYSLEMAVRYPGRFYVAAYVDPWELERRAEWEQLIEQPGLSAVKLECSESTGLLGLHPQARLDDPSLEWLWQRLDERGLTLTLDLGHIGGRSYQTAAVRQLAEAHPALRIVICHLGQPRPAIKQDSRAREQWLEQIELGTRPNVWFDVSSVPSYFAEQGYPFPGMQAAVRVALERLGPDKLLWGSDLPGTLAVLTYRQMREVTEAALGDLNTAERELIFGGNALRVYGRTI